MSIGVDSTRTVDQIAPVGSVAPGQEVLPEAPQYTASPRPPLSPRMIALFGLAIGIAFLIADTLARRNSTDVFWQLAAGQWMLAHHAIIGHDPFSYTESHRRWVNDEWGSELILAATFKAFGAAAYNIVPVVTGSLSLACTMLYARALGARGGRLAVIAILLALGIAGFVTQDRGLSFSLIWLPLELLLLTKARHNPRWLCWLPPLFLLWVNTHGSILLGLMVLGIELVWSLAPERVAARIGGTGRSPYPKWLFLTGVAGVLASMITPYGPGLLLYDVRVATNTQIGQYISEWNSPDFHGIGTLITFCLPVVILVLAVRRRRFMVLELTLTVFFFLGALHASRIVIYLFVAAAGLAATLPARRAWGARTRRVVGALSIAFVIGLVALPAYPAGTVTPGTPVQAFNFLAHHPGRIFTSYTWGDYSIARHRATFADGRTDLFTGPVLTEFFAISDGTVDPDPILARYNVDYVIAPHQSPLEVYLSHDPRWLVVDRTGPALVFARRTAWARS
jgi:hypothetical protein